MGKPLWAKSVLTRGFVLALIFFVASSGALFMGDSFAKYYTANYGEDSAVVGAFIIESDVTEDASLTRSLTMSCEAVHLDDKGTVDVADDEYFVHWPITVTNTDAGGKISTVKMRYDIVVDLPDDARDYLLVTMGNMVATSAISETRTFVFENAGQLAPGVTETDALKVTFRIPRHRMSETQEMINGAYEWVGGAFTLDDITLTVHAEQIQGDVPGAQNIPGIRPWTITAENASSYAGTYQQWNYNSGAALPFYLTADSYSGVAAAAANLNVCTHVGTATNEGYFLNYYIPNLSVGQTYTITLAYKANITGGKMQLHDDFNYLTIEDQQFLIPYTTLSNSTEWKTVTFTKTVEDYHLKYGLYALRFACYHNVGETLNGTVAFEVVSVVAS